MREAERREQAAIEYAKKLKAKRNIANKKSKNETQLYKEFKKRVTCSRRICKKSNYKLLCRQDNDKQVEAQQEISSN